MLRTLLGRAVLTVSSLVAAATAVQLLLWAAPGDPIDLLPNGAELRPQLEAEWGLDQPVWMRVVTNLGRAATGELGTSLSYRPGTPVTEVLAQPALNSFALLIASLVLALAWSAGLAAFTRGRRQHTSRLVRTLSVAPVFLLAHLCIHGLNEVTWSLMEAGTIARPAWFALPGEASAMRTALAVVLLAVGSGALADMHREAEQALISIRRSGFVDAARARGEPTFLLVARHLTLPLASLAAARTGFLLGGLVVVEKVLLINGAGAILWQAALLRDVPVALGITLMAATTVCAARLAADALRVGIDPRLRSQA
ncbi:MAG: ABC transporter permease [Deltaproteobacteria bacterium]|nr:MAG: ABC transporter permease [Deltaproteobacteria bacterium]